MRENTYINFQTGKALDLSMIDSQKKNTILHYKPELWCEWDFSKNNILNLDIFKMTKGSQKKAWWICLTCKSSYESNFNNRFNNSNCPYCAGKKVNHTNSLMSLRPDLVKEWHSTKNGKLTPSNFTCSSNVKVWWICNLGHEWNAKVNDRNRGNGCPYCSNNIILKGFNDMWTTNPELASLLANPDDGYRYMQFSHKKLDWKCSQCGEIVENKDIRSVNKEGLSCQHCVDGKSFPEKVLVNLLNMLKIEYENEKSFKWSKGKRYDFYLPYPNNSIIEIHGAQHSIDRGFERAGGRSIEEEQENDRMKESLAKVNGIEHYIVIDARYSDLEYIKTNILNSELSNTINLNGVNWTDINKLSQSSIVRTVCNMWNDGIKSVNLIGEKTNLNRNTVSSYLKRGSVLGWCDYKNNYGYEYTKKKVVRISIENKEIVIYDSISDAKRKNNFKCHTGIIRVCKGKTRTFKCYVFMYYEDFQEYQKGNRGLYLTPEKNKKIIQLDLNNNVINIFNSISEASELLNIRYSMIHRVCTKERTITHGFKFMYLEDYETQFGKINI